MNKWVVCYKERRQKKRNDQVNIAKLPVANYWSELIPTESFGLKEAWLAAAADVKKCFQFVSKFHNEFPGDLWVN